jgi:hypothetical protein
MAPAACPIAFAALAPIDDEDVVCCTAVDSVAVCPIDINGRLIATTRAHNKTARFVFILFSDQKSWVPVLPHPAVGNTRTETFVTARLLAVRAVSKL